jgi:polyketide synthase 13
VHTVDYFTKGLRHSVWFSQAITKSVENGHTDVPRDLTEPRVC